LVWATSEFDQSKRKERITDALKDPELKNSWNEFKSGMKEAGREWKKTIKDISEEISKDK